MYMAGWWSLSSIRLPHYSQLSYYCCSRAPYRTNYPACLGQNILPVDVHTDIQNFLCLPVEVSCGISELGMVPTCSIKIGQKNHIRSDFPFMILKLHFTSVIRNNQIEEMGQSMCSIVMKKSKQNHRQRVSGITGLPSIDMCGKVRMDGSVCVTVSSRKHHQTRTTTTRYITFNDDDDAGVTVEMETL